MSDQLRILVIDDEEGIHDAFRLALHGQDVEVLSARDGAEGIERAAEARPDLIFLDLRMPGVDGITALHEILSADPTQNVSILTAFSEEFMAPLRSARQDGLRFELIRKPLSGAQIRTVVAAKLEHLAAEGGEA